ncbi:acyl-CoA mutase large subunit family protein [Cloacibacillus porcorum]
MAEEKKHTTLSGYELKRVYTEEDIKGEDLRTQLGDPGHYPFTRGIREEMYRDGRLWTMGQYAGFASAEEANKRFRYIIEQGGTGFSVALDLPTQMGYDSDDPMSEGEVGKVGVAIDSLADIEALFKGIPFEKVRQIRTTANANSIIMLAFYVAFAKKNNIDPNTIGFFLQNDILKEYMCRGTYIFPPAAGVKLSVDVLEYCGKHLPHWTPIAVSGYHIRDAGATAAMELAFTLADMIEYYDAAVKRGVDIVAATANSYFFLGAQMDFLEEVAKYRAARRLYARIMKERYHVTEEEPQRLKIFAFTSGSALTAEQPINNIVRVAIQTMAAAAGGIQTFHASSYDEAISLPTQEAVTVSLRTQQIVGYESGLTETVDPLGGSFAVEALTNAIEKEVLDLLDTIEKKGGAMKCIEEGFQQKMLADNAYKYQKSVDHKERIVVGVNEFKDGKPIEPAQFTVPEDVAIKQTEKINKLKAERDNERVKRALAAVEKAALNDENLGEYMIEAVSAYATLGEICGVLKEVYGKYTPMKIY